MYGYGKCNITFVISLKLCHVYINSNSNIILTTLVNFSLSNSLVKVHVTHSSHILYVLEVFDRVLLMFNLLCTMLVVN
jgi:hypothetical protein